MSQGGVNAAPALGQVAVTVETDAYGDVSVSGAPASSAAGLKPLPPTPQAASAMSWRRRWLNILGLSMGWCLQVSIIFIQLSTSTLAARAYGGDAVSTLPAGIMMAAATLTATPGTLLMRTRGRRVVMLAPGLAAVVGAGLMAVAANYQLLWLLVVGSIPLGVSFAQANNLRFAALEFAPAGSEPQALSLVVTGAVLAAVAGPEVARHTRNAMDPAYVGTYIYMTGLAVLYVVLVCVLEFHRTPELVEEKAAAAAAAAADKAAAADAAKAATRLNKAGTALSQSSDSSDASDSDPSGTAAAGRQQRQRQRSPLAVADASGAATPSTEPAEPAAALAVPPQPPPPPQPQHPQHPHPLPPHPSLPPPQPPPPPPQQHRPLRALFLTSGYLVPAATAAVAYGGMAGLMTASPLALKDSGFDFGETTQVIQVHILCMFVPSLFTGHVIQLVSARWTMALGALLQLGGNAVFFAGRSLGIYFAGNAVVGLGWNWAYVGASALVAVSYQPQEKFLAQGVLDCGVLLATGIAVVLAGVLYAGIGWTSYISLFMGVNGFMVAMDVWLLLRLELPRVAAAMRRGRV
ncbi:hypothetical protein CHLRE_13g591350v5 [Chlamydomonas reinhardtii]|uniref:Major facilitator superfamily (MFS) profile domain-containing protein n=1 Tax=Chlamydomonas reinhardtii TaxID=3055 RepID=A0A2K3D152_CHLRE|nr:uncharacterized protein CHLRE_13g591350v5 [Chlamydomonas reinhardtii]PNW74254.1 hypothetical protein CHLRE_13g591350v5 [Chlamydomonas reinhardtii]